MKDTKVNWILYWIGIAFIVACTCTALARGAGAQEDPCQWEIDNAKSICRALGRKSPECAVAIEKVAMCRDEGDADPIGGLDTRCVTRCIQGVLGPICTTTCKDI